MFFSPLWFKLVDKYNPDEFKYIYQYKDHLGNVRLSYADDTQTLLNTSFNGTYGGFWPKGLSGTYSVTLQGGDLYVNVKEAYGGVLKRINANAIAGEQYRIKLLVDRGTTDVVRLFMTEHADINTPEFSQYATQYLQPGVQEIEFVYTVTESGVLSLQLDKTPASALLDTETYFKILDAKIEKIGFEIIAEDNYYAFGMKHDVLGSVVNGGNHLAQKYKYNGKELQDELGLDWYDYQARNYDPALGRWFNIDPLAEISRRWSPYTYCYNNPIVFVDPDGMKADTEIYNTKGKKIGEDANGNDGNVSIIKDEDKAKEIKKNYKEGGVASSEDVNSGVKTTKAVLIEALDVLKRTRENGGDKEEVSTVTAKGVVARGKTGSSEPVNGAILSDKMKIPEGGGNTHIHSHILTVKKNKDGKYEYGDARVPSEEPYDYDTFKEYHMSIIVGNITDPTIERDQFGTETVYKPDTGGVFYDSGGNKVLILTDSAMEKIVE